MFSLRFSPVQSYVAVQVTNTFFKDCDAHFDANYLDTDFYQSIRLKEFSVTDNEGLDIIYVDELWVDFSSLFSLSEDLTFNNLKLVNPTVNIRVYKGDSVSNFKQWINCFQKSEGEKKIELAINNTSILNGTFTYINENKNSDTTLGITNFNDLEMKKIEFSASFFNLIGDSVFSSIENLSFNDKSGFELLDFSTPNFTVGSNNISSKKLILNTKETHLGFSELAFQFNDYANFSHFNDSVNLKARIDSSQLSLTDLAYFYQPFENINETYFINTRVDGKVSELQLTDAIISKQDEDPLVFKGDAIINGLPDVNNSFFNISANYLSLNKSSLENLQLLKLAKLNDLKLPKNIKTLGQVEAKGSFKGYLKGFMSEFNVETNLGKLVADLNFYYDSYENEIVYDGNISTSSFDVGKFYGIKEVGKVVGSANINANGLTIDDLRTEIKANIKSIRANDYTYQKIKVDGVLQKNLFDGFASIDDANIKADYKGDINFDDKIPNFNFVLNVSDFNFKPLNLSDEESSLKLNLSINGKATSIDDLSGVCNISKLIYTQGKQTLDFDEITLKTDQTSKIKEIQLNSGILDAHLTGVFKLSHIPDIFYSMLAEVIPKKIKPKDTYNISDDEHMKFEFNLKDISSFSQLFFPDIEISKNAVFYGAYDSKLDFFDLNSDIEYVTFKGIKASGIRLETYLSEIYEVQIEIDSISHLELVVPEVSIFSAIYNDNFGLQLSWDDSRLKGDINGNGYWDELGYFHFDLFKTNVSTPTQDWSLLKSVSFNEIDSLTFALSPLVFVNHEQEIRVNGLIGPKDSDVLSIVIDSVLLNDIVPISSIKIEGMLNSKFQIGSLLSKPKFSGQIASNIIINGSELGEIELKTTENDIENKISILGVFKQNKKDVLSIRGMYDYESKDNALALQFGFKKLQIDPVQPFLPKTLANLAGELTGKLILTGSIDEPDFKGNLNVANGRLKISELNTEYTFNGNLIVEPDLIYSTSSHAYDKYGSKATILSASFYHDYFEEYSYEFSVHMTKPFLALNTTYQDNSLFYGTAFATGFVNMSYDKYNLLEIDVEAQSEKGTNITLPLYGAEEVSIGDFVSFVKFSDTTKKQEEELNLSGITMNFNFLATPDAQLNLVFDDVVGDKITAFGTGNIFMEIDQYDQFKMYGQYELEDGEYLFTLKNVINKRFNLAKGGTLNWYGDPYNAEIDIDAVYNVKASVIDLFPIEEQSKYKIKQKVNCYLNLSNNLFSPSVGFALELPNSSENIQSALKTSINTQEELNRQFFSLLLLNKFLPRQNSDISSIGTNVASTSTSEVLTNQLSQVLDKFWEGVDVGVNYESGDQYTSEEYAVALSTQLFNEKLSLSGNFGVSQDNTNNDSNLIGDVLVEYILDENGTFKLKAFNQSNSNDPTRSYQGNYTQGVGLSYQKSFNTWDELLFWSKFKQLFGNK